MTTKLASLASDFQSNVIKWIQNSRGKEIKSSVQENPEKPLKVPLTPFRRNRSRVFYASEESSPSSSDQVLPFGQISPKNKVKIKVSGPNSNLSRRNKLSVRSKSSIIKEVGEEASSSADEATGNFCINDTSPICSLSGSWRGSDRSSSDGSFRGSPSQRSQDSGYSDSGESNNGCHNEVEDSIDQPHVRHITRVYFGDYSRTPSTCDKSINTPEAEPSLHNTPKNSIKATPRILKTIKTKSNSHSYFNLKSSVHNVSSPINLERNIQNSYSNSSLSPFTDTEEVIDTQLEHKSLTNSTCTLKTKCSNKKLSKGILKALFNDQRSHQQEIEINKRKLAVDAEKTSSRHYRKVSQGKRDPKRSLSHDKLLEEAIATTKPRRQEPLKAKRRWSSADIDQPAPNTENCASLFSGSNDNLISENFHSSDNIYNSADNNISDSRSSLLHSSSPFKLAESLRNTSLSQWLGELRRVCESECMNTLQSKSLQTEVSSPAAASTHDNLAGIQRKAHIVSAEFALLCQRLEDLQLEQVPILVRSLVSYIETFVQTHCRICSPNAGSESVKCSRSKASLKNQVKVVQQICNRLIEICSESIIRTPNGAKPNKELHSTDTEVGVQTPKYNGSNIWGGDINRELIREFVQIVTALGHAFTKLVDISLTQGLKSLVGILEEELDEREVEVAISEVTGLGLNGGHVCRLVGRVGGIRALLGVCIEPRFKKIRPFALRALATICCVAEGISHFEKEGGVDVISEILCDSSHAEEERSEAAGVLAQVTSPWVEDNHGLPSLRGHLNNLVSALTGLAESTTSAEVFLLSSAALANLTFLDTSCIEALLSSSTHKVLLTAAKVEENLSVFTKDQIATILANMSSASTAAKKIVEEGGIDILLKLLQTGPSEALRIAEISATERVQQKSAIALSRICTDPKAANQVLTSGGAARLVHLCKNETERNQSDAVLVACLAALRKIATSCGNEELRQVDASELVEPRLLDSFLIYSSQQESYV